MTKFLYLKLLEWYEYFFVYGFAAYCFVKCHRVWFCIFLHLKVWLIEIKCVPLHLELTKTPT